MKIWRRDDLKVALHAQLIESFSLPLAEMVLPAEPLRTGIHLSDLLNVRQSALKRMLPLPVNKREANLFMTGRGFEIDLARRTKLVAGQSRLIEGISLRPDFVEWPGYWRGPIEVKWRRANLAREGDEAIEYDNYIDQAWGYSSMTQTTNALLMVATPRQGQRAHDHLAQTEPDIDVCEIAFTEEDLAKGFAELMRRRDAFKLALESSDPSALPLCYDWLCGTPTKVIDAKPRCTTCDRDFETEFGIEKHMKSKTGAGHEVVHAKIHWDYTPRCKWYAFCRPNLVDASRGVQT